MPALPIKPRILVVADGIQLRATLARWLTAAGYAVELAEGAKRAREVVAAQPITLAIVALAGFGEAGPSLARELGGRDERLILITDPADALGTGAALSIPAAASIPTPLDQKVLLARVEAALQPPASAPRPAEPELLRFGSYTLDVGGRACVDEAGRNIALTRAEFALLVTLARQAGRVVSRDQLSQAVAGRSAEPDDRSVDVLISRLRRKIEPDPKEPRIVVTIPGQGYKFTPRPQAVEATVEAPPIVPTVETTGEAGPTTAFGPTVGATASPPETKRWVRGSLGSILLQSLGAGVVAILGLAGLALVVLHSGQGPRTPGSPLSPVPQFDAAVVPFISDAARKDLASYATAPDYKAVAIAPNGLGVAEGAPDIEAAKVRALDRCSVQVKSTKECGLYAIGMDVVWPKGSPPRPLPADLHSEPLDATFVVADIPTFDDQTRQRIIDGYVSGRLHKGLAVTPTSQSWASSYKASAAEAVRLTVEKCGQAFGFPCLFISLDDRLTIQIPKLRRIVDFFMVTSEPGLSDAERQRIDEVYRQKEWRALARGVGGGWYAVANAASEAAAIDAALASCARHDSGCSLYAIGNFRVSDDKPATSQTPPANATPAQQFDASVVPLVSDAVRAELASYAQRADAKAVAISIDGWGMAFGAADVESAKREALERCWARAKTNRACRIYAAGMNVVWKKDALLLPMAADIHSERLDLVFNADVLPISNDQDRKPTEEYLKSADQKAYAFKSILPLAGFRTAGWTSKDEAVRIAIERCVDWYQAPCLLLAVGDKLTVQIPKSRRIAGLFMITTDPQISSADKQRIAEAYQQKDWRALARGSNGGWYAVANAPSEAAATTQALAACAEHDSTCRLYAISNFRVADE